MKVVTFITVLLIVIGNGVALWHGLTLWLGNDDVALFHGVGPWMSGNGALGLLLLGLVKLPQEMEKWRNQAHREAETERKIRADVRVAEAAATILETVHRMVDAIKYITNPVSTTGEGGATSEDSASEVFLKMINSRIQEAREDLQDFFNAKVKAKMYFDEDLNGQLDELSKIWHGIKVDAHLHSRDLDTPPGRDIPTYREATDNYYDINKKRSEDLDRLEGGISSKLREYLLIK